MVRYCLECNAPYNANNDFQKFCSLTCREAHKGKKYLESWVKAKPRGKARPNQRMTRGGGSCMD